MKKEVHISKLIRLLDELESYQMQQLLKIAKEHVPTITQEDILQPNDYPILDNNPIFRYEEGVLHGIKSTISAINASLKEDV